MFFTWYEVETLDVLRSFEYLDRLGNPTPLTNKIMVDVMKNMNRTVCHRRVLSGYRFGSVAVTVKLDSTESTSTNQQDNLVALSKEISDAVQIARCELWSNAEQNTDQVVAKEEALRGGDQKIEACLLL